MKTFRLNFSDLIGVIALVFVVIFFDKPLVLALILSGLSGVLLYIEKSMRLVKLYVTVAALALVGEFVCVHYFGVWTFAHSTWLGLPVWLPFAYGTIAVFIVKVWEKLG